MNSNRTSLKTSRYEELAIPKSRIDTTSNFDAFKVKRGALSYKITDSLNKLAQPKYSTSTTASMEMHETKEKSPSKGSRTNKTSVLSNKGSVSFVNTIKEMQDSGKKKGLETYARIAATNDRRCSKHLKNLAKPKRIFSMRDPSDTRF